MDRPEHHGIDPMKEDEGRKEASSILPSKVGNDLCSVKHWHCFRGNCGETAERQGGVRIGLSESYDAILS